MIKKVLSRKILNKYRYRFFAGFSHKTATISTAEARRILNEAWPKLETSCIRCNCINDDPRYDLQIIIPVYNGEKYIAECLDSVLSQKTRYSYVIVVINDGSKDKTADVLKAYEGKENIRIIHKENGGSARARNTGLESIDARYIMFVDSDDHLAEGAIQKLLEKAYEEDADIVCGSHVRLQNGKRIPYKYLDREGRILDAGIIPGMPWEKVYRSSLFRDVIYAEDYWFEDSILRFLIYNKAVKFYYIPDIVYEYRILTDSLSHSIQGDLRNIETYWITEILTEDYIKLGMQTDRTFLMTIIKQSVVNARRTAQLKERIQESIFVLTRELIYNTFDPGLLNEDNEILRFFVDNDFGAFKFYCETH